MAILGINDAIHVDGNKLKNALGQVVTLKGINQAGMLDSIAGWWNPQGGTTYSGLGVWSEAAVKFNLGKMEAWGINNVRLFIGIQYWLENANYRQHIKDTATWCAEKGIYLMIVPWFVVLGPAPTLPYPPFIDETTGSLIITSKADFVSFWGNVAAEMKNHPNVLLELFNEPQPDRTSASALTEWRDVMDDCIDAIRLAGSTQVVVASIDYTVASNLAYGYYQPWDWGGKVTTYPLADDNVLYSFHQYRGDIHDYPEVGVRVNCYSKADIEEGWRNNNIDDILNATKLPIYLGEIGANLWWTGTALTDELSFFRNGLELARDWGMSYSVFVWTVPTHMRYGVLETTSSWQCTPDAAGTVLQQVISGTIAPTSSPSSSTFPSPSSSPSASASPTPTSQPEPSDWFTAIRNIWTDFWDSVWKFFGGT